MKFANFQNLALSSIVKVIFCTLFMSFKKLISLILIEFRLSKNHSSSRMKTCGLRWKLPELSERIKQILLTSFLLSYFTVTKKHFFETQPLTTENWQRNINFWLIAFINSRLLLVIVTFDSSHSINTNWMEKLPSQCSKAVHKYISNANETLSMCKDMSAKHIYFYERVKKR